MAIAVCFVALPIVPGCSRATRELEIGAARRLLGAESATSSTARRAVSWATRRRAAAWFVAHLVAGGVIGALTLVLPPAVVSAVFGAVREPERSSSAGWTPRCRADRAAPGSSRSRFLVPVVAGLPRGGGGGDAGAPRPAPARPLAGRTPRRLRSATPMRLAQRNRLARELHDSVGHALSIVTVQAGAAGRVLDDDPGFVREALANIETSARNGLRDLDHVLGLLRDDAPSRAPTPTLADLPRLVDSTRSAGIDVSAQVTGPIDEVPQAVSREAYRIVQESLTQRRASRRPRAGQPAPERRQRRCSCSSCPTRSTPRIHRRAGGGRGLDGIQERVASLRGEVSAGPDAGRWRIAVQLPLHPTS